MPRRDGLSLMKEMHRLGISIPTLIISGEGDIPEAVAAIKLGAIDYVRKPIDPPHLRALLNALAQNRGARRESGRSSPASDRRGSTPVWSGTRAAMRDALAFIEKVAPWTVSVMIFGESGTGKEVAAAMIHDVVGATDAAPTSRSTARPSPKPSWRPNYLATSAERSPAPIGATGDVSSGPTAALCCSTKSRK